MSQCHHPRSQPSDDSPLNWNENFTQAWGDNGRTYVFTAVNDHWHVQLLDVVGDFIEEPPFSCVGDVEKPSHSMCLRWAEKTEREFLDNE